MSTITEKVKASTDADIQRLASRVVELEGELQCAQRSRADSISDVMKACREWAEMDTEIKAITTKCGVSDHTGVPGYGFKSAEDCVQELADKWERSQAEIKRLREALEKIGATGTVYVYPENWNSAKEVGSPEINDFYEVDLYSIVKEALSYKSS